MWRDPRAASRRARDPRARDVVRRDGRGARHARRRVLANVVASQAELHARYGGVVPEVASRRHLELVAPVVREALDEAGATLDDVEPVAVTQGPGLIGALLVGLSAAKALAWARRLPLVAGRPPARPRRLALPRSPTRSSRRSSACSRAAGTRCCSTCATAAAFAVLGTTLDDAAGEAFDKGARLLGLGYPGGAAIDRLAREGDPEAYRFPVARVPGLDFSFSGLKTALLYAVRDLDAGRARARGGPTSPRATSGRSSARSSSEPRPPPSSRRRADRRRRRRRRELRAARARCPDAALAPLALCTDNAAMIASAARYGEAVPCPTTLRWMRMRRRRREAPQLGLLAVVARRPRRSLLVGARGRQRRHEPAARAASAWRGLVGEPARRRSRSASG